MLYNIVDIGSNSIRLSVFKVNGTEIKSLFSQKTMAGLGSFIKDGIMLEKGTEILIEVLEQYKDVVSNLGLNNNFYAFATAPLRNVSNGNDVRKAVKKKCGITIDILSGKEEARLSYAGAKAAIKDFNGAMVDIGGGSMEFVLFSKRKIESVGSIGMGSLTLFRNYVSGIIPTVSEKKQMSQDIVSRLEGINLEQTISENLCCVGGSGRAALKLYNLKYQLPQDNLVINSKSLNKLVRQLTELPPRPVIFDILRVKADRLHTLIPGMVAISTVAKYFNSEEISISQTGVREGYLKKNILRRTRNAK